MKKLLTLIILISSFTIAFSQNAYDIQFQNSNKHEAIISPVPMATPIFFVRSNQLITKIEVINILGKTVYVKKIRNYTFEPIEINLPGNVAKGVYFVRITFDDNTYIIKKTIYK